MSKFSNKSGSGDRDRPKSRDSKRPRRGSAEKEGEEKPKSYKAKRSFTKNKSFRDVKNTEGPKKSGGSFGYSENKRPFKKSFDKGEGAERSDKPKRSYGDKETKKPYGKDQFSERPRKNRDSEDGKPQREDKPTRSYERDGDRKRSDKATDKPYKSNYGKDQFSERPRKSWDSEDRKPQREDKPERDYKEDGERKRTDKKEWKPKEDKFSGFKKASGKFGAGSKPDRKDAGTKRRLTKPRKPQDQDSERRVKHDEFEDGKAFTRHTFKDDYKKSSKKTEQPATNADGLIRLNKYLSNAGVASRRDADNLILGGTVKVNGVVVDQLGYKIKPTDKVTYGDSAVRTERKVYLLLNKPKDYITTVDDPKERKTVMELIQGACRERLYPVGRLDRNTTGLLLFTNDGELTTKLTHPKHGVKKVYHVSLNKGLKPDDFKSIVEGFELEDGPVKADDVAFVGEGKKEVGIEIHSGRNRIVRRMFEHLGYDVLKLDRVVFAGLTKKDLPRGKHRFLTAKEISFLQMIG